MTSVPVLYRAPAGLSTQLTASLKRPPLPTPPSPVHLSTAFPFASVTFPLQRLRGSTGFTPVEVFRKYLWYGLRERQFEAELVADMVALRAALALSDAEVRSQQLWR